MFDVTRVHIQEYLVENELAILRRIKHPNIIKLVEEFQNNLKYFLVFEYVSVSDITIETCSLFIHDVTRRMATY
jgi:serine/threonine protein kinase